MTVHWFDNGNPAAAGNYAAERKGHGKWQYFHKNGQLSSIEVFDKGSLRSKQYFTEDGSPIADTTSRDRAATFPGGQKAWMKYLQRSLYFPSQWKISGADEVVVVVDWAIDEDGKVVDAWVSAPFHPEFDKIALEVIRKSPQWQPCISHNRRIKDYRRQPVTFSQ
jgi:outer membrane biosynthesis protein TonB